MKLKAKNISLMIATAMFVFAGITGAAAQADKIQVEIKNNIQYGVEIDIVSNSGEVGTRASSLWFGVRAGESKAVTVDALPEVPKIFINPLEIERTRIRFLPIDVRVGGFHLGEHPSLMTYKVSKGLEEEGAFTMVSTLKGNKLEIVIDSRDPALRANAGFPETVSCQLQ